MATERNKYFIVNQLKARDIPYLNLVIYLNDNEGEFPPSITLDEEWWSIGKIDYIGEEFVHNIPLLNGSYIRVDRPFCIRPEQFYTEGRRLSLLEILTIAQSRTESDRFAVFPFSKKYLDEVLDLGIKKIQDHRHDVEYNGLKLNIFAYPSDVLKEIPI